MLDHTFLAAVEQRGKRAVMVDGTMQPHEPDTCVLIVAIGVAPRATGSQKYRTNATELKQPASSKRPRVLRRKPLRHRLMRTTIALYSPPIAPPIAESTATHKKARESTGGAARCCASSSPRTKLSLCMSGM
eukprot:scaffold72449_cov30-Tisochrysis_lutea.AAC.3